MAEFKPGKPESESSNNFLSEDFQKVYYTGGYKNWFQGVFFSFQTPEAPSGGNKGWASSVSIILCCIFGQFWCGSLFAQETLYLLLPRVEN